MIKNYDELMQVKQELKNRIHETEQDFISQHKVISTFINMAGAHKNKKHEQKREKLHALIIQGITEYLKDKKHFKKYKKAYLTIGFPLVVSILSSLIIKRCNDKS